MGIDSTPRLNATFIPSAMRVPSFSLPRGLVMILAGLAVVAAIVITPLYLGNSVDVRVATATYKDIEVSVSTMGKVTPVGEYQARANFPGMVDKIYVHPGQKVVPGQLLVGMKDSFASSRVASAAAALKSAQVSYQNIQNNGSQEDRINFTADMDRAKLEQLAASDAVSTMKELQRNGSASGAEVLGAEQRLRAANATLQTLNARGSNRYSAPDVASWKARVEEAKAALLAQRSTLANAEMTSPIAGTVYLVPVTQYDFVGAGADLVRVADLSKLGVRALFDEPDIGKLAPGQPVTLRWDGRPDKTWRGHLERVPMAVVTSGTRSVGESVIAIDGPVGDLPANTNVTVSVTTGRKAHVLTIPREALQVEGTRNFIYLDVRSKLTKTSVEIGMVNLNDVEITKGLQAGDVVALHALSGQELKNNLKIGEIR